MKIQKYLIATIILTIASIGYTSEVSKAEYLEEIRDRCLELQVTRPIIFFEKVFLRRIHSEQISRCVSQLSLEFDTAFEDKKYFLTESNDQRFRRHAHQIDAHNRSANMSYGSSTDAEIGYRQLSNEGNTKSSESGIRTVNGFSTLSSE